jgi:hypothetical protein
VRSRSTSSVCFSVPMHKRASVRLRTNVIVTRIRSEAWVGFASCREAKPVGSFSRWVRRAPATAWLRHSMGRPRAIRCACRIRDEVRTLGLEVRSGLHAGPGSAAAPCEVRVRLSRATSVSASRCSSRRISIGSREDGVPRSRRRAQGILGESSQSPARHMRFAMVSAAQ